MKNKVFLIILLCILSLSSIVNGEAMKEYKGRHFLIYYNSAPFEFVKSVDSTAENYYSEIAGNFGFVREKGWISEDRAKIYIYDDQESYMSASRQAGWAAGSTESRHKMISTFLADYGFFDTVLPHELGHIIFREFVGYNVRVPIWFEEGIAMVQEKAKRVASKQFTKDALRRGSFKTLNELAKLKLNKNTAKEDVDLFYAESACIVNYMINDLGGERFKNFCRKLKDGVGFEQSLEQIYYRFKNINDLNKSWEEELGR